jgi:hypothetical protein
MNEERGDRREKKAACRGRSSLFSLPSPDQLFILNLAVQTAKYAEGHELAI